MSDVYIHIGEMLARNARMYPNDVALVERMPTEEEKTGDHVEGIRRAGEPLRQGAHGRRASGRATRSFT